MEVDHISKVRIREEKPYSIESPIYKNHTNV